MVGKVFFLFALFFVVYIDAQSLVTSGVPCDKVKAIVNKHNELRGKVAKGTLNGQPKASNMQKIAWDNALANMAQNWAKQMKFQHNPNRQDGRFYVGENLYMSWSSGTDNSANWANAVQAWFNEHNQYTYKPMTNDPKTGHYTQVVWANTKYVGCGYAVFMQNNQRHKLYVCNYGPGGNYLNQYPYQKGNGCENLCCSGQCNNLYGNNCKMSFMDYFQKPTLD